MERLDEKILDRIRRLLAMAKDSSSPHEAAIAARRAQKLMEQHNIENVESILDDLEDAESVGSVGVTNFKVAGNSQKAAKEVPRWCNSLSVAVARLFDCEVRTSSAYKMTGVYGSVAISFYGYKTDLVVCQWTFEFLLSQIRKFNNEARKRYGTGNRELLTDYRLGVVSGILEVIEEALEEKKKAEQAAASMSKSTALVVVKHNAIAKKFGGFKYTRLPPKAVNGIAWAEGVVDGRSVKLSNPLSGPGSKPLLQ